MSSKPITTTKRFSDETGHEISKALASMSVEQIEAQLQVRREQEASELEARKASLLQEVAQVDERIAALSGQPTRRRGAAKRGARAQNEKPLAQFLVDILRDSGSPMSVQDLITKLEQVGFKSNAKNKYPVVFTALNKNEDLFKKIGRGVYGLAA